MTSRFDYVKYDDRSAKLQSFFKQKMIEIETDIEKNINDPRAKAMTLTKLEEVYAWIGKGIRNDQLSIKPDSILNEQRS